MSRKGEDLIARQAHTISVIRGGMFNCCQEGIKKVGGEMNGCNEGWE